ncbi:MAG: diguanylate cyclase [Magnetococcales bacterium]|nr:diguanylate cyclase [Magnetococcales bacterium]NGZ27623.1 diguanylate cyclase [Magnetococcales bacterium]
MRQTARTRSILLRQAALRVFWVLTAVVVLVTAAAVFFQHAALNRYAASISSSLRQHYSERILLLDQDWQESAIRLHARIEFMNLFKNKDIMESWNQLRAALTQENHDLFPLLLVVNDKERILFDFHTDEINLPERFSVTGKYGWYDDVRYQRLYRWYAQPLWLGHGRKGHLVMFIAMDNGLMFRNAMPLTTLMLVRDNHLVASSSPGGEANTFWKEGSWEEEGVRYDQITLPWGGDKERSPLLVVRHRSNPLFTLSELALVGVATLVSFLLLLWVALGLWIIQITWRMSTLGVLSREFSQGTFDASQIKSRLEEVKESNYDEITQVADALFDLASTVDRHTRKLEKNASRLKEGEERFRALTNSLQDVIVAFDSAGAVHYANLVGEEIFGSKVASGANVSGLFAARWLGDNWQKKLLSNWQKDDGDANILEGIACKPDGGEIPVEISLSRWLRNKELFYTAVIRDISERRTLESRDLRAYVNRVAISALLEIGLEPLSLRRKLEVALEIILTVPWLAIQNKGSIFVVKEDNRLEMLVQKGLHPHLLVHCRHVPFGHCLCGRAAASQEIVFSQELNHLHDVTFEGISQHGHYCVPILLKGNLMGVLNLYVDHMHQYDPEEEAFLSTIANTLAGVMDRALVEERIHHLATHDTLTNLPNRMLFKELLEQELRRAIRQQNKLAVGYFDLDHFKEVNDTLGHNAGDLLLKTVADRVKGCLRESDILARMGGDEFTLILPNVTGSDNAMMVAEKVVQVLRQPFDLNGDICHIGASIGISLFPDHGQTAEVLLQRADQVMYDVKRLGRNAAALYDSAAASSEED